MKTFSLTEFRRDPVKVLRAASGGVGVTLTRRGRVVYDSTSLQSAKTLSAFDLIGTVKPKQHVSDTEMKSAVERGIADKWREKH